MTLDQCLRSDTAPTTLGSMRTLFQQAVDQGCRAPSELNSQPWLFHGVVGADGGSGTLDLLLDESRGLPAVDPSGREALLACGAALLNVRLALRGAGVGTHVSLGPDAARPELLARITVAGRVSEAPEDQPLRRAIAERSTHRGPFLPGAVPLVARDLLVAEAAYEGAFIEVLDDPARARVADLNREAERLLWQDGAFRREVASWTNGRRSPGQGSDLKDWHSWLQPGPVQSDPEELEQGPLVAVVSSVSETRPALLRAGCGLQRLLLAAATHGLSVGFLDAALHVPDLRAALSHQLAVDHPQVVLRIGYAASSTAPRSPRRNALVLQS